MSAKIKEGIFKDLKNDSLKGATPFWSSVYSGLTGVAGFGSHHKKNIKTIFKNLQDPKNNSLLRENGEEWRNHQDKLTNAITVGHNKKVIDAKVRNDVYVANIMDNQEMMREAAQFCLDMSKQYGIGGERADRLKGAKTEVSYLKPNQNIDEKKNTKYRSYYKYFGTSSKNNLSKAIGANTDNLDRLAKGQKMGRNIV